MSSKTPRHGLPYILSGQSQKEATHAEGLNDIDLWMHPVAESAQLSAPPAAPGEGRMWIVGPGATAAWSGHDGEIAQWLAGSWRFRPAFDGLAVWVRDAAYTARFLSGTWEFGIVRANSLRIWGVQVVREPQPPIGDPSGGAVADQEARTALSAILGALRAHGLVAS